MKELKKQLIDQPLHILMGIISVCLFSWLFSGDVSLAIWFTFFWIVNREVLQWPSSRWWDPPLDWIFELLGIYLGYVIWIKYFAEGG